MSYRGVVLIGLFVLAGGAALTLSLSHGISARAAEELATPLQGANIHQDGHVSVCYLHSLPGLIENLYTRTYAFYGPERLDYIVQERKFNPESRSLSSEELATLRQDMVPRYAAVDAVFHRFNELYQELIQVKYDADEGTPYTGSRVPEREHPDQLVSVCSDSRGQKHVVRIEPGEFPRLEALREALNLAQTDYLFWIADRLSQPSR